MEPFEPSAMGVLPRHRSLRPLTWECAKKLLHGLQERTHKGGQEVQVRKRRDNRHSMSHAWRQHSTHLAEDSTKDVDRSLLKMTSGPDPSMPPGRGEVPRAPYSG